MCDDTTIRDFNTATPYARSPINPSRRTAHDMQMIFGYFTSLPTADAVRRRWTGLIDGRRLRRKAADIPDDRYIILLWKY